MTVRVFEGHVLDVLRSIPSNTFQCAATSPPYYGLRDYGLPPQVWGGEPEHEHAWSVVVKPAANGIVNSAMQGETLNGTSGTRKPSTSGLCACGAWLGSLGLEPTPELYVEHLVSVFREVRRTLRPDGVCWLNLGDSMCGAGYSNNERVIGGRATASPTREQGGKQQHGKTALADAKPKDLLLIPEQVALALRADGWWVRSRVPWVKRNAMPESQASRPSNSVEYVFLLAKSDRYFWDAAAVRVDGHEWPGQEGTFKREHSKRGVSLIAGHPPTHRSTRKDGQLPPGRNRRNGDWLIESFNGLVLGENGSPLCFVVNPQPFKAAHFAVWPAKLVEPMLLAGSRPGDHVLDPFGGAGTTGLVADRLGRDCTLVELNPVYASMARERIASDAPLFVDVA